MEGHSRTGAAGTNADATIPNIALRKQHGNEIRAERNHTRLGAQFLVMRDMRAFECQSLESGLKFTLPLTLQTLLYPCLPRLMSPMKNFEIYCNA